MSLRIFFFKIFKVWTFKKCLLIICNHQFVLPLLVYNGLLLIPEDSKITVNFVVRYLGQFTGCPFFVQCLSVFCLCNLLDYVCGLGTFQKSINQLIFNVQKAFLYHTCNCNRNPIANCICLFVL